MASFTRQPSARVTRRLWAIRMVKGMSLSSSRLNQSAPTNSRSASSIAMLSRPKIAE